jgi:hypothetical protein
MEQLVVKAAARYMELLAHQQVMMSSADTQQSPKQEHTGVK